MNLLPRLECRFFDGDWKKFAPGFLSDTVTGFAPNQITWFNTAWTGRELRVLFHVEDNDAWATLTEHDAPLYQEEVVEIFLDPFGDLECYFEIEINPLNAVCDLVLRKTPSGYRKNFDWHCEGLQTVVTKQPEGWTAEISIPFASLGPDLPVIGKSWRANFCRIDRPKNSPRELSAWSPTGRPTFHVQQRFGFLDFVR